MPLSKSRMHTNGSTIGGDFMNSNMLSGTKNSSMPSFSRIRPGTTGNSHNSNQLTQGVEMYYGNNRRGGSASFNKRSLMRKNGNQTNLAAIQNTQNKLVASLNINNKNTTMMRNHNSMNKGGGGGGVIATTMDQKQQEMYNTLNAIRQHSNNTSSYHTNSSSLTSLTPKRFGTNSLHDKDTNKDDGNVTSAAVAAAAAANVVKENTIQKQQRDLMLEQQRNAQKMLSSDHNGMPSNIRVKKNVRWNTTIATIASAESNENAPPSHRENDAFSSAVISILAVGGKEKERQSIYINTKTPKGKKKFLQQLNTNTDSAAATVMNASNSMALLANIKDNQNTSMTAMRPHTSGSLESGSGHRGGARGKHAVILEIRRNNNNNNNNNNIDYNTNNLSQNSIGSTNSVASERPQRPSLSEQLAAITANASNITKDIRSKHGLDSADDLNNPPLVTLPAKSFSVGTLCCRYPSPTRYYKDRLEYTFHHPYENSEVLMVMYYR